MEVLDEDRKRAEVFDALAHPTRIGILKMLQEEALSFGDLKRKMGIESSGHLQHHLSKLGDLIRTDEHGRYYLSDQGKDALFTMQTVENVSKEGRRHYSNLNIPRVRTFFTSVIVLLAIISIGNGFYILNIGTSNDQYLCDVMTGSSFQGIYGVSSSWFEIPPGNAFNYTAMVFSSLNPPTNYYSFQNFGTFSVSVPTVNNTYYRMGFLGFRATVQGEEPENLSYDIFFGSVTGPNGSNAEAIINPYSIPPYKTRLIEPYSLTLGYSLQARDEYIIPIQVFGNYTFRMANIGNGTIKAKYEAWPSTVTLETRLLREEDFPVWNPTVADEKIVRIRRQPASPQIGAALLIVGPVVTITTLCIYLIERKNLSHA